MKSNKEQRRWAKNDKRVCGSGGCQIEALCQVVVSI